MRHLALALALSALTGCAWYDSVTGHDTLGTLRNNHVRWAQLHATDYQFVYARGCECLDESVAITVNNGFVFGVYKLPAGPAVAPEQRGNYPTIDSLFALAERELKLGHLAEITYDAGSHFPTMIHVRPSDPDGDYTISVSAFFNYTGMFRPE